MTARPCRHPRGALMPLSVRRLLVILAVAGAGFVPAPANAAYCSGSGVNVVVDRGALGGGITKDCDSSGNRNAARAFEDTGHHLTYVASQPGFVCSVDGAPQPVCPSTPPADAYWGLYWSDGTGGWKYASVGATSLTIPAGGSVAFSWQNGGGDPPGVAPASPVPATHSPTPTPTQQPRPTKKPATGGSTSAPKAGVPTASLSTSAGSPTTADPTATPSDGASPSATAAAGESPSSDVSPPADAAGAESAGIAATDDDGGGLPWWVPVAVLVGLAGGGGTAWWRRRRSTA